MRSNNASLRLCLRFVIFLAIPLCIVGCSKKKADENTLKKEEAVEKVADKQLAEFQSQLLGCAFEAASKIPAEPYIKDRCRVQEKVVDVCLELAQPVRAVQYSDNIKNWRRGLCYANTAYYLAQNRCDPGQVRQGLVLAEKIAEIDHRQKWRSDRIKARIAQTNVLLGDTQKAEALSEGLEGAESKRLMETKAVTVKDDTFNEHVKALDTLIAKDNFDVKIAALSGYVELFNRFYEDAEKRTLIEDKIKTSWGQIPVDIRMNWLIAMAEHALAHTDTEKGLVLVNEAQVFLDDYKWKLRNYFPAAAKLITLRYKVGDSENAKEQADKAMALFNEQRGDEHVIYRVSMLYPLAEGYQAMGQTTTALSVYKQAAHECVGNPKSRTRAEDLAAICLSLAVYKVEPDAELWELINQVHEGLGEPW